MLHLEIQQRLYLGWWVGGRSESGSESESRSESESESENECESASESPEHHSNPAIRAFRLRIEPAVHQQDSISRRVQV